MVGNWQKGWRLAAKILPLAASAAALGALLFAADILHHGTMVNGAGSTADCLICHDGTRDVPGRKGKITPVRSHKVLVPYPPPGRARAFYPLQTVLAAGIRLENGRITCISCHDLNNGKRNQLAIDTTEYAQKLCYVCHLDIG